ncbi:hypothetical protein BGZ46_000882 [Entomortierella lignicola]|nr:hypothetical protein BGZ46_000882 [Entomortierella lignicola]
MNDSHADPRPDRIVGITVQDDGDAIEELAAVQDRRKPGLHGKARIWGPNKTVRMIFLTTALMGLQFTWSVEMAYGTPFLLQLGLSKSLMSLVWLAGPLSGLVMQPVLVNVTIMMAVGSIYILDFAINCVQASCRTLIVDSLSPSQQEAAASWASRLMGIGGIFGYFMGNVNLPQLIPVFGDTQIKCLCIIACLFLISTVGLTCFAVTERVMIRAPKTSESSFGEFLQGFRIIFRAIRYLPTRIQHLCNVQFFAWMGWFPFLFYSSTYIAEIYTQEKSQNGTPIDPDAQPEQDQVNGVQDAAIRAGSYCLLIYSIVSLGASMLLPIFVTSAEQIITGSRGPFSNSRSTSTENGSSMKIFYKSLKIRIPRYLRPPIQGLTLPRMYTLSLALLSFSLISTWYIRDLQGSTVLFAFCGVAWAVSMWAPFSILGEVISQQMQEEQHQARSRVTGQQRGDSTEILFNKGEDDDEDYDGELEEIRMAESVGGGIGGQYQPIRIRESLDEAVTVADSNFKAGRPSMAQSESFRSRTGSPSPPTIEGQPSVSSAIRWSAPQSSEIEVNHKDDHSSDQAFDPKKHEQDEEGRLIKNYGNSSRHSHSDEISGRISGSYLDSEQQLQRQQQQRQHGVNRDIRDVSRPLIRSSTSDPSSSSATQPAPVGPPPEATSAGALLGIHNIYIVLPQFLVSFLSSLVFAAIEPRPEDNTGDQPDQPGDPETIGVMLRIGGVMAGIAALLSLRLWKQPRTVVPLHM